MLLIAINVQAEKYTIYWDSNPDITEYFMNTVCLETGFGTIKRFGSINSDTIEYTVDLLDGMTYNIMIRGFQSNGGWVDSNKLTIKTKKAPVMKKTAAPVIKVRKTGILK